MTAYYIMRQLIEHMLYHYRSSNNADFKQLELDDKLYKALRQDSACDSRRAEITQRWRAWSLEHKVSILE